MLTISGIGTSFAAQKLPTSPQMERDLAFLENLLQENQDLGSSVPSENCREALSAHPDILQPLATLARMAKEGSYSLREAESLETRLKSIARNIDNPDTTTLVGDIKTWALKTIARAYIEVRASDTSPSDLGYADTKSHLAAIARRYKLDQTQAS